VECLNYSNVKTVTLYGLQMIPVVVEIDVDKKAVIYDIDIVGLGDTVVKESKKRVKSAIKNSGFKVPNGKIVVNLAPSDVKKEGSYLDLPIAVGLLKANDVISKNLDEFVFFGELGLDGSLRKVRGVLPILISLQKNNKNLKIILPKENESEASVVEGIDIYVMENLNEMVRFINGYVEKKPVKFKVPQMKTGKVEDMSDIKGQEFAKRAAEVAAAGGHNILFMGSPGCGKTMLARRIPGILPPMTLNEAIETTMIYSISGLLNDSGLITTRPYRSPHHTASSTAIIGGGTQAKPGEISLAHNGVLFLDEFPEFRRDVIEALRQPLEDSEVTISRAKLTVTYPSRFMLVLAQNPCPCGWYGDDSRECTCNWNEIKRYNKKISGPMEDRIDIFVNMPRIEYKEYRDFESGETSEKMRSRVEIARRIQLDRLKKYGIYSNSQLSHKMLEKIVEMETPAKILLENAADKMKLTGRSIDKILKVCLTISDLEGERIISPKILAEALQYRKKQNNYD
jgi:magnesium chelatase family protein